MDNHTGRAGPSQENGNSIPERRAVDFVNEDTEESDGLVVGIGLELGAELDDKAEVIAENKRACTLVRTDLSKAHAELTKIVLLEESLVGFFGHLITVFIEPSTTILLSGYRYHLLFWGVSVTLWLDTEEITCLYLVEQSIPHSHSISTLLKYPDSSRGSKEHGPLMGAGRELCSGAEVWTGLEDSVGFRGFFDDLMIVFWVGRTVRVQ